MFAYQAQDAQMTLAEGLAEYHAAHPFLKRGDVLSPAARDFFDCHDAVHVVYGCDTRLSHEAVVKLSSFFATDGSWRAARGYVLFDSLDIYRKLPWREVLGTIVAAPVLVPRILYRCARQRRRWPWSGHAALLDRPLADIRVEYGIRVATDPSMSRLQEIHA